MTYDCIIIGGGLAGLTCGIRCLEAGLKTIIISDGMNALHFSSGSLDVIGYDPKKKVVTEPFSYLPRFLKANPSHPYAKTGIRTIRDSLDYIRMQVMEERIALYSNADKNHFHITALGTKKPTYLSQPSVFNERLKQAFERRASIAVLNFQGYRDFFVKIAVENLKRQRLMKDVEIRSGLITLPYYSRTEKNLHEFRSIDLARVFDNERYLPRIAEEILKSAGDAEIVGLPAFIGINNSAVVHRRLQELTGKLIYEAPSLPPSILGMRIDNALKNRFAALQGVLSMGDRVIGATINDGRVEHILTKNNGATPFRASYFVLASGSFFSGGLKSEFNSLEEPVFGLKVYGNPDRSQWYSQRFFENSSHPFLAFGIETNKSLQPTSGDGKVIKNLFCAGSILAHYNPVKEASGSGVAIATGYHAAQRIIHDIRKGK